MKREFLNRAVKGSVSLLCAVSMIMGPANAQNPAPDNGPVAADQAAPQPMAPGQLETLLAPIALYPDPLLSQVLAASTYPLEVVEAEQWIQQNANLRGADLMNAARQQNWDPSVQALVAFPDTLKVLTRDIRWTTDLGNAFLAQQKDVMDAVQRLRVRAEQNGRLATTRQQTVTTQTQDGQSAVVIEPADPQVMYVPQYNPAYVWGPPLYGYYPPLWYPSFGFGFGPGIYLGGFFPGWGIGFGGWGVGWGWGFGWFGGGIYANSFFFNHYGFHNYYRGGFAGAGRTAWQHDSFHRAGVPYANRNVAARYNNARYAAGRTTRAASASAGARSSASAGFRNSGTSAGRSSGSAYRGAGAAGASRSFSGSQAGSRSYSAPANRGASSGSSGYARGNSAGSAYRGSSSGGAQRSYTPQGGSSRGASSASRPSGGSSAGHSYGGGGRSSGGGGSSSRGRR